MNKKNSETRWPSYNPGEFRHIVQIQQQAEAVDGMGQPQQVWPTVLTCKAAIGNVLKEIMPVMSGREFYNDGMLASRVTYVITIRWTKIVQISEGMRVYFVDQRYSPPSIHTYQLVYVENVENRDVLLRLGCFEINGQT